MNSKISSNAFRSSLYALCFCVPFALAPHVVHSKEQPRKPFMFLNSYKEVKSDPDKIWVGDDLSPRKDGTVSIYEYELRDQGRNLLISQIWNDNCSISECPTRVFRVNDDGSKNLLVEDMMHQVIPENDEKFRSAFSNPKTEEYAKNPFFLSARGNQIINSDYKFDIKP